MNSADFYNKIGQQDGRELLELAREGASFVGEGGKTILVVDDEPGYLYLLAYELSNRGYYVITAQNGREALTLLEKEKADLVITDMRMPVMDGLDTVVNIRKINENIPIILVTAFAMEERVQLALTYKATTYLKKPFELDKLIETVNSRISPS